MKALVIGGTGTMGGPLVEKLYNKGYSVSVVCRNKVKGEQRDIQYYYGNAKQSDFIKGVLAQSYDVIVDFMVYSSEEFQKYYELLLNSTNHYICLSSAAVYSDVNSPKNEMSPRFMETDPPVKGDSKYLWYCYEKARIEDTLIHSSYNNWTIIRPGMTMGSKHYFWGEWIDEEWMFRIIHNQKVIIPTDMLNFKASITYGADVADMIVAIIDNKESLGEIYNVTSPYSYSWAELLSIYESILAKYGFSIRKYYLSDSTPLIQDKEYVYKRARLLDRVFDSSKVYNLMGEGGNSFTPIDKLLEEWIMQYVNLKPQKIRNQKVSSIALIDRLAGDYSPKILFVDSKQWFKYVLLRYSPHLYFLFSMPLHFLRRIKKLIR